MFLRYIYYDKELAKTDKEYKTTTKKIPIFRSVKSPTKNEILDFFHLFP